MQVTHSTRNVQALADLPTMFDPLSGGGVQTMLDVDEV
jgi:hypothetical protein